MFLTRSVYAKIVNENMKIKEIFNKNLYLKDGLEIKFAACLCELMPEGVMTSFYCV